MSLFKLSMAVIVSILICPALSQAGDFSLGLGAGYRSSPYKSYDGQVFPAPFIHYEGERFYWRGLSGGIKLLNTGGHELSAGLLYDLQSFRAKDSDDPALKQLRNRQASVNVLISYLRYGDYGTAGVIFSQDISGHSKGRGLDAFYQYSFDLGKLYLKPGVGLRWESAEKLKYYYGVSRSESLRSGLSGYEPESALSPYLSLDAGFTLTEAWSLAAGAELHFLSGEVKDSPMVDAPSVVGGHLGLKYSF